MSGQGALFSAGGTRLAVDPPTPAAARRALRLLVPPSAGDDLARRGATGLRRAAAALTALGLFTVSWDRFANVAVGPYNVKLPSLLFSVAFVLAVAATRRPLAILTEDRLRRTVAILTAVLVAYLGVRGLLSAQPGAAIAQLAAVLSGAVLPAAVLLLVVRGAQDLRWALRWTLAGALVAAVFGLYQLTAFYLGLPQGVPYTGVGIGIGSGLGRITAFSYEPAYFAYYVVLALGAWLLLRRLDGAGVPWLGLAAFALVLYLANVRALPLLVLAAGLLLLLAVRANRTLLVRGTAVFAATCAVAVLVPVAIAGIGSAVAAQQAAAPAPVATAPARERPSAKPTATPSASADADPDDARTAAQALQEQAQESARSIDPAEASSNAPRLGLYKAVLAVVQASPAVGIGPGNLTAVLRRDEPSAITDQQDGQVVANNVWLQALADGGIPALLLELALVVVVAAAAIRRRGTAGYPLAAAWLAVVLVGGMLTSYFFDIKVWVMLALLLVAFGPNLHAAAARDDAEAVAR